MDASLGGVGSTPPPFIAPVSDNPRPTELLGTSGILPDIGQDSDQVNNEEVLQETSEEKAQDSGMNRKPSTSQPKATSATCLPKAAK